MRYIYLPLVINYYKIHNRMSVIKVKNNGKWETIPIIGSTSGSEVGKIDSNSDGTREIFNNYDGEDLNISKGNSSHAEGKKHKLTAVLMLKVQKQQQEIQATPKNGKGAHAEGNATKASGNHSHSEGFGSTASG